MHRATSVCCMLGQRAELGGSLDALKILQHHIVSKLGAQPIGQWKVEVDYKLRQKKKSTGSEMKFGINVAAPFAGMKRDESDTYPYAKQFWVRRSEPEASVFVVQEMAEDVEPQVPPTTLVSTPGAPSSSLGEDKSRERDAQQGILMHVLKEGNDAQTLAASPAALVSRLKAVIIGHAFQLGDFCIRAGSCSKGAVHKGLALEVEYLPSCRIADGLAMIEAFLTALDEHGRFVVASDLRDPAVYGGHLMYSGKHTAVQTIHLFNRMFS